MKPSVEQLLTLCPGVKREIIRDHCERLDTEYFERFSLDEIAAHLVILSRISPRQPFDTQIKQHETGEMECTILAYDYPFEFSLLAGTLSSMSFEIESGDIFTYERALPNAPASRKRHPRIPLDSDIQRRRIIDRFSGICHSPLTLDHWSAELRNRLFQVFMLLEQQTTDALQKAKYMVNEWVTERLASLAHSELPVLYPVQVDIENAAPTHTVLRINAQDTPAFLYSLTTALSLHGFSIEKIRIRTIHGRVEDEITFTDLKGHPITDVAALNRIKLSVLFTKQFTYYLDRAPDPFAALSRFEQLVQDICRLPGSERWMEALSDPRAMQDLARLLGTSDFLWEDFIRLQYEALLPILEPHIRGRSLLEPPESLPTRLEQALSPAKDFESKRERLNAFKDRELFLIDLEHILNGGQDFRALAERLTWLAEHMVRNSCKIVHDRLRARHGTPRTVAGMEVPFAVFGLGKFGGAAMGYASDIELLFVFSDHGMTDGPEPLENAEFFSSLARETAQFIAAKREGIFHVDLRLRPYGNAGPLACSLESFCRYYGPTGEAHSYERLALVRLRAVAGDPALGERVERLRDEFIYETPHAICWSDLQQIRRRQLDEKSRPDAYNAKFSPGALVDVEYTVQALQVMHARNEPALRTPKIHAALDQLRKFGILSEDEQRKLVEAYDFLRRLINGLRMLRGSARDLYLPPVNSEEFMHLARRMGYLRGAALTPTQQLFVDFETHTAAVRTFVKSHFGRRSAPASSDFGNIADVILSPETSQSLIENVLRKHGFHNIRRAYTNLQNMARPESMRDDFVRLAVLATDMLRHEPDPDMALNNWERFVSALPDRLSHYRQMLSQPKRLELLLSIFSRSQYLADRLIRHPEWLEWVTTPEVILHPPTRKSMADELRKDLAQTKNRDEWLAAFNRFRQKQLLRIGARDMCFHANTREIMADLSCMAEVMIDGALSRAREELAADPIYHSMTHTESLRFCVLAFGKLGGAELNYSSDIDLLGIYERGALSPEDALLMATALMEKTRALLTAHTDEGHAFRVDLRLRPYGRAGELVYSVQALGKYYREAASFWEIQAALKLRPVAGEISLGGQLLNMLRPLLLQKKDSAQVARHIRQLREIATRNAHNRALLGHTDLKTGIGGIRDIEFLVQGLQLIHADRHPELLQVSTLNALLVLANTGILPYDSAQLLCEDYVYLRRVEHYLQILENRQIHTLPTSAAELMALARRVHGPNASGASFAREIETRLKRVREMFLNYLPENP